jgi:hypothetical protein
LEKEIFNYAYGNHKREMEILMSVPGIGEFSAAVLIAEIFNFKDFPAGISVLHGLDWFQMCINQQINSITVESQREDQRKQGGF